MRDRFRTFDSKITFFAFADIITAVSGMLIFITLLLATDLGRPANGLTKTRPSEVEERLQETLAQQAEADTEVERLQQLLASAEAAPDAEKLESDIAKLRLQLTQEQAKEAALNGQITNNLASIAARDRVLGLTGLKVTIDKMVQEIQSIEDTNSRANTEMHGLEQQVAHAESQLLKLNQREGQVWLVPDRSITTKEAILVTVTGDGIDIERFDRPDEGKQADGENANDVFSSYLNKANSTNQYVVFLIKPSGLTLFQALLQSAHRAGFDVGYDALEENRQIHFSTPPSIDEPGASANDSATTASSAPNSGNSAPATSTPKTSEPKPPTPAAAPPPEKSWWQKLLEWVGLNK